MDQTRQPFSNAAVGKNHCISGKKRERLPNFHLPPQTKTDLEEKANK